MKRKGAGEHLAQASRELLLWWQHYNDEFLGGGLTEPMIKVQPGTTRQRLGSWDRELRMLAISATHIEHDSWLDVMDTLRHEMAHQYADEVLGAVGEQPHGAAFRRACEMLRVSPAATVSDPESMVAARGIADKVAKLLALAGSDNENEARTALKKSRELLLRHNLGEVNVARRSFGIRRLGPIKGRHMHWEAVLGGILSRYFFVHVIWVHTYDAGRDKPGTVLEVHGTETNLQMAEYVHAYVTHTLERLWKTYKQESGVSGQERQRFFAGVVEGFEETLQKQGKQLAEQHALVWQGDSELAAHVRYHHPRLTTRRTAGARMTRAYEEGRAEGRRLRLHRPLDAGKARSRGFLGAGD